MDTLSHTQEAAKPLEDELDREFAPAWKPQAGEKLVGIVTDISTRDGEFGRYPIVTLRTTNDEGEELALHAFHEVLANELARLAPKVGDELGVKYLGKHEERGYHRYRVRRAGASAEVDWSQYGATDVEDVSVNAPLGEGEAVTAAALEEERDERDSALSVHEPLE